MELAGLDEDKGLSSKQIADIGPVHARTCLSQEYFLLRQNDVGLKVSYWALLLPEYHSQILMFLPGTAEARSASPRSSLLISPLPYCHHDIFILPFIEINVRQGQQL